MAEQINSVDEVIERLGGDAVVARMLGISPQAVWNWKGRDKSMPADTFMPLSKALNEKDLYAPPSLWRWREAVA